MTTEDEADSTRQMGDSQSGEEFEETRQFTQKLPPPPSALAEDEEDEGTRINPDSAMNTDAGDATKQLNTFAPTLYEEDGFEGTRLNPQNPQFESGTLLNPDSQGEKEEATAKINPQKPPGQEEPFPDALPAGQLLLWYRIEKVLGQGGFGITYKAFDPKLNQYVALKEFLPGQLAIRSSDLRVHAKNPSLVEAFDKAKSRFLDEARTLAQFKHNNLVRVVTFFEELNTAYMAMDYEDGESLSSILKEKKTLEEAELLKIVMPLLQGLTVLHEAKFIHRDIKPDNIYIRKSNGTPVLLDFGATRKMSEEGEVGKQMTAMLTPSYAPMEQYFDDASRQGPWTDIYAMGAVMYRVVSGRKPVGAPQRSNAIMRGNTDPLTPAVVVGEGKYSLALLKAIDLALQVLETDRPRTITEWLQAVKAEQGADQGEAASAFGEALSGPRRMSRNTILALTVFATLALGGIGYGVYTAMTMNLPPPVLSAEQLKAQKLEQLRVQAEQGVGSAQYQLGRHYEHGDGLPADQVMAITWYRKAATQGAAEAQTRLGVAYESGTGVPRDDQEAVKWYEQAAQGGDAEGQYRLGLAYVSGKGMGQDITVGVEWFLKAAVQGLPEAQYQVGVAYESGAGVTADDREAIQWYMRASEKEIPEAMTRLALFFELGRATQKDAGRAAEYYQKAAEKGVAEAQYQWGIRLIKGEGGVSRDAGKGAQWLELAAIQGHPQAQLEFAQALEKGDGVSQDGQRAYQWYRASAEQGVQMAQLILANMHLTGQGAIQDHGEAARWLEAAARQGNGEAQNQLGTLYLKGLGVPKEFGLAMEWYERAAKGGHAGARNNLGKMYEQGMGVTKDYSRAIHWYRLAADQGLPDAQNNLGWMYEEGRGIAKDLVAAARWYLLAAEQGDIRAQNNIAWMYEDGKGVGRDVVKAFAWYSLAAAQNDAKARKNLSLLAQEMSATQVADGQKMAKEILAKRNAKGKSGESHGR